MVAVVVVVVVVISMLNSSMQCSVVKVHHLAKKMGSLKDAKWVIHKQRMTMRLMVKMKS
jgi:hypothetical protein